MGRCAGSCGGSCCPHNHRARSLLRVVVGNNYPAACTGPDAHRDPRVTTDAPQTPHRDTIHTTRCLLRGMFLHNTRGTRCSPRFLCGQASAELSKTRARTIFRCPSQRVRALYCGVRLRIAPSMLTRTRVFLGAPGRDGSTLEGRAHAPIHFT